MNGILKKTIEGNDFATLNVLFVLGALTFIKYQNCMVQQELICTVKTSWDGLPQYNNV